MRLQRVSRKKKKINNNKREVIGSKKTEKNESSAQLRRPGRVSVLFLFFPFLWVLSCEGYTEGRALVVFEREIKQTNKQKRNVKGIKTGGGGGEKKRRGRNKERSGLNLWYMDAYVHYSSFFDTHVQAFRMLGARCPLLPCVFQFNSRATHTRRNHLAFPLPFSLVFPFSFK